METRRLTPAELTFEPLRSKTIAVLGYGNQGRAHALNLRDRGLRVIIGQRPGGRGFIQAQQDGFAPLSPSEAATQADVLIMAFSDQSAPEVFRDLADLLRPGQVLGFIHGFNIHYRTITPPDYCDVIMVAPKGPGAQLREQFVAGGGLACLVAVHQDASSQAWLLASAWAAGIGADRATAWTTTFAAETETDLFGEQVAVVGGVTALMYTAYELLTEAGYSPVQAYYECVHEVKFVVDLIHQHGLAAMSQRISDTARFGDLSCSPRIAEAIRPVMRQILEEIRTGVFARNWLAEQSADLPLTQSRLQQRRQHPIEQTHQSLAPPV
ncbi:MAG: Ketol-acid reductoisomerase (NADP(+)) [Phycisphaerae bacterium]|nr:Ketol-acid reductoisomerase (NADP(+)) [Phycisphaerae bacterium]